SGRLVVRDRHQGTPSAARRTLESRCQFLSGDHVTPPHAPLVLTPCPVAWTCRCSHGGSQGRGVVRSRSRDDMPTARLHDLTTPRPPTSRPRTPPESSPPPASPS